MKKTALLLIPNLIISVNLFSMQSPEYHYVLKESGQVPELVVYDHYVQPYVYDDRELVGPWEDSLSEEFKSVTPQAMLHYRAIKKIIGLVQHIGGESYCFEKLNAGSNQMVSGLKLRIDDYDFFSLRTPFGELIFKRVSWVLGQNIREFLLEFIKAETEEKYLLCSGALEDDGSLIEKYKIHAVDGEHLPEPIESTIEWPRDSYGELIYGVFAFVPSVWFSMEQMCERNMKAAQLALLVRCIHGWVKIVL